MRPHAQSLLGRAWRATRGAFLQVVATTLVTSPTEYADSVGSVLERTLDLYK